MAKKTTKEDLSKEIMREIKEKDVKMHSKLYFRLLSWALITSTSLFIMLSALTGLIAYRQINFGRGLTLSEFGGRGNADFLTALPWMAIIAGVLTAVAAYILVKHFDVSYRYRFYILIVALIVAVLGLGVVFAHTGVGDKASSLPPFRGMHSFSSFSKEHRLVGEVIRMDGDNFVLKTNEEEITIYPEDQMMGRTYDYQIGDTVTVFGDRQENGFKVYGIRPSDKQGPPRVQGTQNRYGGRFLK